MGKYAKTIGCKVEQWVFDKIQIIDATPTEYLRNLIDKDLNEAEAEVNHMVNRRKTDDESLSIDDKVDLILKHKNDE